MKIRNPKSGEQNPAMRGENGSLKRPSGRGGLKVSGRTSAVGIRAVAFSLIEILVVVALLSVIILGLLAMFTQTQRAFRTSLTQTDVLASGRLVSDMLGRELEQIAPAYQPGTNFYARIPFDPATYYTPFIQPLPGTNNTRLPAVNERTNFLHDLFFISKRNQDLVGIGYFVRVNNPQNGNLSLSPQGVGNLYRFESTASALSGRTVSNLFNEFALARLNDSRATKLAEGVIHFKVRAFDTNGAWIVTNQSWTIGANYANYTMNQVGREIELYEFASNAVPGAVEVELGILEDKTWQRFKALPAGGLPPAQYKFLTNQAGRVHLFRQRVAVRNLDPIAYQ